MLTKLSSLPFYTHTHNTRCAQNLHGVHMAPKWCLALGSHENFIADRVHVHTNK